MDTYRMGKWGNAIVSSIMVGGIICLCVWGWNKLNPPKEVTAQYTNVGIMLPNGHKVVAEVTKGDGKIFIPQDTLSEILGKNIQWNKNDETLYIGQIPNALIMSQEIGKPYQTEPIWSLYNPQISIDSTMTMGSKEFNLGYSFKNVANAEFALNGNYQKLKATLGIQDNTCANEGILEVYLDKQLYKTFELSPKSLPEDILLEVKGANQMSFVFKNFDEQAVINLADVYIR